MIRCPECEAAGQTSRVRQGDKHKTNGRCITFWDGDAMHVHEAAYTITPLSCSRGHSWEHKGYNGCPTCGGRVDPVGTNDFGEPS